MCILEALLFSALQASNMQEYCACVLSFSMITCWQSDANQEYIYFIGLKFIIFCIPSAKAQSPQTFLSVCSCWLHAHLLSRDSCLTVRSVPLSVRTVCLTGLIIRVWRGLPDWRPFKCWILKCHFAASAAAAAAAAQALRRVSGAGNVIAHILPPTLFSHFPSAFSAIVSLFSLSFSLLRFLHTPANSAALVLLEHEFGTQSRLAVPLTPSSFIVILPFSQPVWLPHPKTFNFFCLMAFLCIANCRSACFQLGISMASPRKTRQTQKDL